MTPVEVSRGRRPGRPRAAAHRHLAARRRRGAAERRPGRALADTDWHVDELYAGLLPGATTVRATFHRYLIDANRGAGRRQPLPGPEHHRPLPARPTSTAGRSGGTARSRRRRRSRRASPASTRPTTRRSRPRSSGSGPGTASRSSTTATRSAASIPFLFDGTLPDFNVGTADGASCAPAVEATRHRRLPRGDRATATSPTAASRAAGPPGTTAAPRTACTPSRWSWRSRPTSPPRRRPGPGDAERAGRLRRHLARHPRNPGRAGPRPPERAMSDPRKNTRDVYPPTGPEITAQVLADRGADADADEQPAPRRRREPARARGLRRHRPRRAHLGRLRPHRRDPEDARATTRPCWCSPASRSASSAPTPTRRAC